MKTAVVTCHKDEPALLEWIAYQRAIGFDDVFVYDDGSAPELLARLHAAARRASWLHVGTTVRDTTKAVQLATLEAAPVAGYDWVANFDTDEYLVPLRKSLKDTLGMLSPDAAACVVNWRHMGAPDKEEGLLIERITQATRPQEGCNRSCKFLYRPGLCRKHFSVHTPNAPQSATAHDVDGGPAIIEGCGTPTPRHHWFQLNHYRNRDLAWFTQRQARGNIEGKPLPEAQWHAFARLMTDQDTKILAQAENTKAILAELEWGEVVYS